MYMNLNYEIIYLEYIICLRCRNRILNTIYQLLKGPWRPPVQLPKEKIPIIMVDITAELFPINIEANKYYTYLQTYI